MQISLSIKLAYRFLNSKRYGALARFISVASTTGICVGVCALIVGLSAMNGFEYELNNRVLSLIPAGEFKSYNTKGFEYIEQDLEQINSTEHVLASAPAISINGAFSSGTTFVPAKVIGIDPILEPKVISLERFMSCKATTLEKTIDNTPVIIGNGIAKKLHLSVGDTLNLSIINTTTTNDGLSTMVIKPCTIVGLFKTGGVIDSNFAFIHIRDAAKFSDLDAPNTIHVAVDNMLNAREIITRASDYIRDAADASTWIDTQGKLYSDINMIRTIMYLAMILVIAVACFNIVSNLIMAVSEKRHEIAILMTMGASKGLIILSFTLMGIFSALKGCLLGGILGSLISCVTPYVTSHFKDWFGFELLNEDIYFINFVPSELHLSDVMMVIMCALIMSFIASIYPAIKASKIQPALELNL